MERLRFTLDDGKELLFTPKRLHCLAYAGRTKEAREAHAQDVSQDNDCFEEPSLGFNPVAALLITQDDAIEVLGGNTAGEVEFVLFVSNGEIFVTLGSDHADRRLEMLQSDLLAKQVCAKPIAKQAWRYDDVYENWDKLQMKSETFSDGVWHCSQQSCVDALLHPNDIMKEIRSRSLPLEDGCVYYCGTVSLEGGKFWYGDKYRITLSLPNSDLAIKHEYDIVQIVKKFNYFVV